MKDPVELTSKLRSTPALLQPDESIEAAFKCGRDMFLISTKRVIVIDKKGITGKSVEYKSYPLMYNKAFRIETEGHLLNGSEVKIYTDDGAVKQELAKGQKDNIWSIHDILSEKLLNNPQKEIGGDLSEAYQTSSSAPASSQQHGQPLVAAQVYQPQPFIFQVQLPPGVEVGGKIQVQHPQTKQMLVVTIPAGVEPGGVFSVSA